MLKDTFPYTDYISCIKIDGKPILPPLITDEYRSELLNYKEQALALERKLRTRKQEVLNKDKVNNGARRKSEEIKVCKVNTPSQTDDTTITSPKDKKRASNLTSYVLDVAEFSDNGCKVVQHNEPIDYETDQDSTRYDLRSVSMISSDGEPPKLVRSASYTLDNPSPVLLAHMERQTNPSSTSVKADSGLGSSVNMTRSCTESLLSGRGGNRQDFMEESPMNTSDESSYTERLYRTTDGILKRLYDCDVMELKPAEAMTKENYFPHYSLGNFSHTVEKDVSNLKEKGGGFSDVIGCGRDGPGNGDTVAEVPSKVADEVKGDSNVQVPDSSQQGEESVIHCDNQPIKANSPDSIIQDLSGSNADFYKLVQDLEQPLSIPLSDVSATTTIIRTETVEYIDKIVADKPPSQSDTLPTMEYNISNVILRRTSPVTVSTQRRFSSEDITALSGRSYSTSDFHNRNSPTFDYHNRSNPTSDTHNRNSPTSGSHNRNNPTSDSHNRNNPTSDTHSRNNPTSDSHNRNNCISDSHNRNNPTSDFHNRSNPTPDFHNRNDTISDFHNQSNPSPASHNQSNVTSDIHNQSNPALNIPNRGNPASDTHNRKQPASAVTSQIYPTPHYYNRSNSTPAVLNHSYPASDSEINPSSDTSNQISPTLDVTYNKNIPTSDLHVDNHANYDTAIVNYQNSRPVDRGYGGFEAPPTKVVIEKVVSLRIRKEPLDHDRRKMEWAASKIGAAIRGYLTRRLMKTEKVQGLIQTIQDAVLCAVQLHDVPQLDEADVELHRRLIQQVSAACYAFHDMFFSLTVAEQMNVIANDRKRKLEKAKKCMMNSIHDGR